MHAYRSVKGAVGDHHLDFDLGEQVRHLVFRSPVDLLVAFLSSQTSRFEHGHPFDARIQKGVLDVIEFVGANDRLDLFYTCISGLCAVGLPTVPHCWLPCSELLFISDYRIYT